MTVVLKDKNMVEKTEQSAMRIYNIDHIDNFNVNNDAPSPDRITRSLKGSEDILYPIDAINDGSAIDLLNPSGKIEDLVDAIKSNGPSIDAVYRFRGTFTLDTAYEGSTRYMVVKTTVGALEFKGKTSPKKWSSQSYMENYRDAGSCNLYAVFHIIGLKGTVYSVQYLAIAGGHYGE